jgi:AraC family transcriptional regulator, 4-hydroxyphenylacetate 3-monooxygenase operon regulatory protein
MVYTFKGSELGSLFGMSTYYQEELRNFETSKGLISIIWNRTDESISFTKDNIPITLASNQITTSTFLQKLAFNAAKAPLTVFTFNREFYCIQDHDEEVSCNGIIFFGTQASPIITLNDSEISSFNSLYQVFLEEFTTRDNIQGEMLGMLLKRLIIKITRIAKEQVIPKELNDSQIDIIRKFNVLVDINYKEKKQVNEYAELLFKSPKTLSNLFAKYNQKSPIQVIHERIVLEGKRMLLYTDKNVKEIAYELGFNDATPFHKLFKKVTNNTPQEFKKQKL